MKTVPCKAAPDCAIPILWAETPEGARIPLDSRAPVYRVEERDGKTIAIRMANTFVTHFATCRHADRFSKGKASA